MAQQDIARIVCAYEVTEHDVAENPRKRKDPSAPRYLNWDKYKQKKARVEGKQFKNWKGVILPERILRDETCKCKCSSKLSIEEKNVLFKAYHELGSHDCQTIYLNGCTILDKITNLPNGKQKMEFKHLVRLPAPTGTVYICQKYFLGLHGIKRSRLRTKVLQPGSKLLDGRGRHLNHPRISDEVINTVKDFFRHLPARPSHYSKMKNFRRLYLQSNLNIKLLHRQFLAEHEHITPEECNYYIFRKIFRRDFNIRFGFPRSDICTKCERLDVELKYLQTPRFGESKDVAKIAKKEKEIQDHLDECEYFVDALRLATTLGEEYCCICFDFEKNLPLPVTNTSNEFFLRQLWAQNFGIHNIQTGKATMFLYSEHYALKGANEVISCLSWYVQNKVPPQAKILYLFCDNCGGQNKNKYVFSYLQYLADTKFDKVVLFLPEPGHSRMPIDQNHGKIEIYKKTFDKINSPSTYVDIITNAQPSNPFEVCFLQAPLTDDLTSGGRPVIPVMDYKASLESILISSCGGIRAIRHIVFKQDQIPLVNSSEQFGGNGFPFKILNENYINFHLQEAIENVGYAYDDFLPIMPNKFANVKFLLKHVYIPPDTIFYDTLYYEKRLVKRSKGKKDASTVNETDIYTIRMYD